MLLKNRKLPDIKRKKAFSELKDRLADGFGIEMTVSQI